jgi:hypothetical protein
MTRPQNRRSVATLSLAMKLACRVVVATFAIGAVGTAAFAQQLAAAPIAALANLNKAPAVDVQTMQWGTQYGPDYGYYGPRYRSYPSGYSNPGERSNTRSQYGADYGYYGPRYRVGPWQSPHAARARPAHAIGAAAR